MIARTIKAKFLVFTIFFLGIGTGVLVANFYTTRVNGTADSTNQADGAQRAQRAQRDINKFYDYLGLDQAQREQMHKIGEETRHEFQDLRKETQPGSKPSRKNLEPKFAPCSTMSSAPNTMISAARWTSAGGIATGIPIKITAIRATITGNKDLISSVSTAIITEDQFKCGCGICSHYY